MIVYDLDLRGGFTNVLANLIDIRQCDWVQSADYQPDAAYGYLQGDVTIRKDVKVSPILHEDEHGKLSNRCGTWPTEINKGFYDLIYKWNLGSFDIHDAWWAIPKKFKNPKPMWKPYELPMKKLLAMKSSDDEMISRLSKKQTTGLYGYTGQVYENKVGKYFNPPYFAECSSQCSVKVAEFLYRHGIGPEDNSDLVHISVDGCLVTKEIDISDEPEWKLAYSGPALIISSGTVFFQKRHPQGLYLDDVVELMKSHPRKKFYEVIKKRPISLSEAVNRNRLDLLGQEIDTSSSIDLLRISHDRHFPKLPKSGESLLNNIFDSVPLVA